MCQSKAEGGRRCPAHTVSAMRRARTQVTRAEQAATAAGADPDTDRQVLAARARVAALQDAYDATPTGISERMEAAANAHPASQEYREHVAAARRGLAERMRATRKNGVQVPFPGRGGKKSLTVTGIVTPSTKDAVACREHIEQVNAHRQAVGKAPLSTEVPPLYELSPSQADQFQANMNAVKGGGNRHAAAVYVYAQGEYARMRMLITPDGQAGVAVKEDGDIVSVHSIHSEHARYANNGQNLVAAAKQAGGTHLDCYDTVLPSIYSRAGFVETGRDAWDEQYKPDDWDYSKFRSEKYPDGRPDVVYMRTNTD